MGKDVEIRKGGGYPSFLLLSSGTKIYILVTNIIVE